jgi:hypothetical protein
METSVIPLDMVGDTGKLMGFGSSSVENVRASIHQPNRGIKISRRAGVSYLQETPGRPS